MIDQAALVWLRRLFVDSAGAVTGFDSRSRIFLKVLREAVMVRDRWCRTPWCGAPIRHIDHVIRHADGGPTSADNGQGLCQACNLVKEAPGWRTRLAPGRRHRVTTITPPGAVLTSEAISLGPLWSSGEGMAGVPGLGEQYLTNFSLIHDPIDPALAS